MPRLSARFTGFPSYPLAHIPARKKALLAAGVDVIDLGAGDADLAPPAAAVQELQRAATEPAMQRYGFGLGHVPYREAIVAWMERRFGTRFDPMTEVVPLLGSKEGLAHVTFAFAGPGDVTVIPDPAYQAYLGGTLLSDATPYVFPLRPRTNFLIELDEIPEETMARTRVLYLNYPNNPTAAIAPREYLERVVATCRERDILLVYDNAYSEMGFDGYVPPSIFEIDGARDVAIEFHSLSKTYNMTGWRCGWAVAKPELAGALAKVKSFTDTGQYMGIQSAGVAAIESWESFVPGNVATFQARRDAAVAAFRANGFYADVPQGTMYLWMPLPDGIASKDFADRLREEQGVIVLPGSGFGAGGEGFFRISFIQSPERIAEAAKRAGNTMGAMMMERNEARNEARNDARNDARAEIVRVTSFFRCSVPALALALLGSCGRPLTPAPAPAPTPPIRTPAPVSAPRDSAPVPNRTPGAPPAPTMSPVAPTVPEAVPAAVREFRGVWVASVANIDWPSKRTLSTVEQQRELLDLLDRAVALNLNAVLLQVRPAADALYASKLEPWSEYLTGAQGRAPDPYYDPLEFAVREAHARGLELHAWFNPYRARNTDARSPLVASHIARTNPSIVKTYARFLWMDPAEPLVRERTLRVVLDVVRRYDIDGVHIDDYFYPYPENDRRGREIPFPDDRSWERYRKRGGQLDRGDWRRSNVDSLVRALDSGIHRVKPWVKFGISPFGIWRPGYPASVRGLDAYEKLFADARKWLREGWLDYFTPQLYWPTTRPQQSYTELLAWWASENVKNRHLWAGNFTSRAGAPGASAFPVSELLEQIRVTRAHPGASGNVHFSMVSFLENQAAMNDALVAGPYAKPALVPATPWLAVSPPPRPAPRVIESDGRAVVMLATESKVVPWQWLIRYRTTSGWSSRLLTGPTLRWALPSTGNLQAVWVSSLNRAGTESAPVSVTLTSTRPPAGSTPRPIR